MAYFPHHYSKDGIKINIVKLADSANGLWIDPQSVESQVIDGSPFVNNDSYTFTSPEENSFGDRDWIMVLETNK